MQYRSSIVVLGGGPAGLTASIHLSKAGIPHVLIEKGSYPRDKICGDALSGKVVSELRKIEPALPENLQSDPEHFLGSFGVSFVAPNGRRLDIPFKADIEKLAHAPGFLSRRIDFDRWLSERMDSRYADLMTGTVVRGLKREQGRILIDIVQEGITGQLQADLVIGAEGDRSLTARQLGGLRKEPDHYCAGIRTYYEGVSGFHEKNFIELHFLKDTLPGYLWIFPLPNGGANVGIGMLSSAIARRRTDLKGLLEKSLQQPSLRERFSHARRTDPMRGWGLPLGSKKRKLSGDGFLLTGDAGSLIDPFTGEGIGNAMISGRIAAETAVSAIQSDRFDGGFLERYDRAVYAELWEELRLSRTLQRLSGFGWLFNFVANRAAKNTALRESITAMFDDMALRGDMGKPLFYLRLLFSGNEKRS